MDVLPDELRLDIVEKEGARVGLVLGRDTLWIDADESLRQALEEGMANSAPEARQLSVDWLLDWVEHWNTPADLRNTQLSYDGQTVRAVTSRRWLGLPYMVLTTEGEAQADAATVERFVTTFQTRRGARLVMLGPEPAPLIPLALVVGLLLLGWWARRRTTARQMEAAA